MSINFPKYNLQLYMIFVFQIHIFQLRGNPVSCPKRTNFYIGNSCFCITSCICSIHDLDNHRWCNHIGITFRRAYRSYFLSIAIGRIWGLVYNLLSAGVVLITILDTSQNGFDICRKFHAYRPAGICF